MQIFDEHFWLAVCFIIFVYLAYRPVRNAIIKSLDSKIDIIKARVSEAELLRKEAMDILAKAENEINQLESIKNKILEEAKETVEELTARRNKEIELNLTRMKNDAECSIAAEKTKALRKMEQEFIQNSTKLALEYFSNNQKELGSDIEIAKVLLNSQDK
jgi:F0F1-type ATP synthase membrane subunit b/b'